MGCYLIVFQPDMCFFAQWFGFFILNYYYAKNTILWNKKKQAKSKTDKNLNKIKWNNGRYSLFLLWFSTIFRIFLLSVTVTVCSQAANNDRQDKNFLKVSQHSNLFWQGKILRYLFAILFLIMYKEDQRLFL